MYKRTFIESFRLAWTGIQFIFKNERNMKLHCIAAVIVIAFSFVFRISLIEFLFVIFCIALVMIAEAANTAFEQLLNFIHGDKFHPNVKILKDIAAGGVFIAALSALFIGCIIFIPRMIGLARGIVVCI